ncbi:MAG: TatD family hydrolase [Candidatus Hydrogenedentes bacterium]|nr:TatD family hydrolase [Candidatus Hydrogenedentota bacterium]
MILVDAHCHLHAPELADAMDAALDRARAMGVQAWITCAVTTDDWATAETFAATHPGVFAAAGIHPWYGRPEDLSALDHLAETLARGMVAVGECGLDTRIADPPLDAQRPLFARQVAIAREVGLPLNLHCRGAWAELLAVFRRERPPDPPGILHNFNGSAEVAAPFLDLGFCLSFGGVMTRRNSRKLADAARRAWPDHLALETDAPDLPPVEAPTRPNLPENIVYVARAVADLLKTDADTVAEQAARNAARVFRLPLLESGASGGTAPGDATA